MTLCISFFLFRYVLYDIIFLGDAMKIEFYSLPDGSEPVKDFLESLDTKMRAKVVRSIDLLEMFGSQLREPDSKELDDGIMELRTTFGGNISRVLYFFIVGNTAVLTNGFIKKTVKTPSKEILLAKKYRDDYKRRNLHDDLG